jgi:hypothetical protein
MAPLVPRFTNQKQIGFASLLVCKSSCELRFAVKGSGPTVSSGAGDYESSELWQMDSHGGNRTLLASTRPNRLTAR